MKTVGESIFEAASSNDTAALARLLAQAGQGDINFESNGDTPLIEACKKGHLEIVQMLLRAGASGRMKNFYHTALLTASEHGHADIVKVLLPTGETFREVTNKDLVLNAACHEGHTAVVQVLVNWGANSLKESDDRSSLMVAAERGNVGVLRVLLSVPKFRARMDAQDKDGRTALAFATYAHHADVVKLLEAYKDARSKNGDDELLQAVNNGHFDSVKHLIAIGADRNAVNIDGDTAVLIALKNGNAAAARFLMEAGVDVSIKNKKKETARSLASKQKMTDLLCYMDSIEYASVNVQLQASQAPQRAEMIQRLEAAHAQYDAAEAAAEDFELIASLGKALPALQLESARLPLSEEDYLTLPARHAQLMQRIEMEGKRLKKAKDFAGLETVGAHLESLKALQLPNVQDHVLSVGKPSFPFLLGGLVGLGTSKAPGHLSKGNLDRLQSSLFGIRSACDLLTKQASQAPLRADMIQRLEAAQAQFDTAMGECSDLSLLTSLGSAVVALQQQAAQLPLSEEDYLTLPARHAELVQRIGREGKQLIKARLFDELIELSGHQQMLSKVELPKVFGTGAEIVLATQARSKASKDRLLADSTELGTECKLHLKEVTMAAQRKDVTQRLEAAQAQYDAADAAGDLRAIGALGKALAVVKAESDKIPLTQKDYLTLADRHAQLVQRVVDTCQQLAAAGKYHEIAALASKINAMKVLDLSALPTLTSPKAPGLTSAKKFAAQSAAAEPVVSEGPLKPAETGANTITLPAPLLVQSQEIAQMSQTPKLSTLPEPIQAGADASVGKESPAESSATPQQPPPPLLPQPSPTPPSELSSPVPEPPVPAVEKPAPKAPFTAQPERGDSRHEAVDAADIDVPTALMKEEDRRAMAVLFESTSKLLHANTQLQQVMRTVAVHDRTLQMLVSKEKECPSLFWFYPKKPELRRWLSDPATCLFQDTLMMLVVCPVTLCVVECGPEGVGWEVNKPKEWVKKWGPAILFSIYVMQAAVVAGRVVGIPLPPVPGAADVRKALGLKGMLGGAVSRGLEEMDLGGSLAAFQEVTIAELEQTVESQALIEGLSSLGAGDPVAPLPADLPMQLVGEAYKSIHTFLTTGENAELGKLEDQLRGRMERVMAPDGDIEWVSVQGKDAWLQKRAAASTGDFAETIATTDASPLPSPLPQPSTPAPPAGPPTWLGEKLTAAGIDFELVQLCDRVLVREQGFGSEKGLARMLSIEFDRAYLTSVGISATGLQLELLELHRELRQSAAGSSGTPPPLARASSAKFTEEDRQLLRQLKLQQRAPEPTTTHTVDRGNQMQLTASAFSQQGPQGAQDQQQLARRIAELEARLAETQGVVTEHITVTTLQFENNAPDRADSPLPPSSSDTDAAAAAAAAAQKGCCAVS